MNGLMISWYINLILEVVLGIATVRAIYDSTSEKTPEIKKALAPAMAAWLFFATVSGAVLLYVPYSLMREYVQPKFGWVVLSVLAAIIAAWKLGCFTSEKTEGESKMSEGERRARLYAIVNGESYVPFDYSEPEEELVDENVYGVDPSKPALTEKSPVVYEDIPIAEGYWAGVSSWRQRDFKGSLIKWLRENGPKSHLIPATKGLCEALNLGSPYWNKNIVYGLEGVSLTIWDKKFFFRWEDLFFHVEYDLYDYSTVEVSETSIVFKPARTFHLLAKDGTEISWDWSSRSAPLGSFEVEIKFPQKVVSHGEDYIFEYQDGMSGCYGENIPVYYFASDLAMLEKLEEDQVLATEAAKVAKKS